MNPMLDVGFIANIKETSKNNTEAKQKLKKYAFDKYKIKLNGQKSFENMVKELSENLDVLSGGGPIEGVENGDGISIDDLIAASNVVHGIEYDKDKEPSPELVDEVRKIEKEDKEEVQNVDTKEPEEGQTQEPEISTTISINTLPGNAFSEGVPGLVQEENIETIQNAEERQVELLPDVILPRDFKPVFSLLGAHPGYYTIYGWIYDWISKTPDWKGQPAYLGVEYEQLIKSYIYYIRKNGQILVKETTNNTFKILR